MSETLIRIPYFPRPQFRPFHASSSRFNVIVAHRRAGKTVALINKLVKAAILCTKTDPRFAYVAPLYNQAKDIAWTYLKRYSEPLWAAPPNETELRVDLLNSARIRLYGADNPDRLRGLYFDGVGIDEPADMSPVVWPQIIRPMLADRKGWADFIGTPKGHNQFYDLARRARTEQDWAFFELKASETGILAADELASARRDMTPEQYEQEFECSFEAAILGAYFGKEMAEAERDGRITVVPYDDAMPVHTAWDLGMGDSTAIWFFQVAAGEIRVIDWYENHGQKLAHYAAEIRSRNYRMGTAWLPHDARVRELGTGRSRVEVLSKDPPDGEGLACDLVPDHGLEDGINAARVTLPRCWFDAQRCKGGIEALKQYRTAYDEDAKVFLNKPKHDWTSHTADAFRYLAMAWREMVPEPKPPEERTIVIGGKSTVTLDDVWEAREREWEMADD